MSNANTPPARTVLYEKPKTKEYNGYAYSICFNDNKWNVIQITYSKADLSVGTSSIIFSDESQIEAEDQMKIKIAERVFD